MIDSKLLLSLLLILGSAWLIGYLFTRLRLPFMLGELLAGFLLGPPVLGLIQPSSSLELLAELGIFFVMFFAGMEMDPKKLLENFWPSLGVAFGGFVLPFILGFGVTRLFGGTIIQSLFVGLGISITAIAVQAMILQSMRINHTPLGHIIIGAAIVDDILSLLGLSVLLGLAKTGTINVASLGILLLKVSGFFAVTIGLGELVIPRIAGKLSDRGAKGFTFALIVALFMAFLAEWAGLHLIIGAFLAGQFIRREIMDERIYEHIADRLYGVSYGFLVPVFFVSLSFYIKLEWTWSFGGFALALIVAAVIGKLVGCGLISMLFGNSKKEAAIIGFGMNGRGAVELVVASVVMEMSREMIAAGTINEPLLTGSQFSALVLMAFGTTMMAPLALRWAVLRTCLPEEGEEFCRIMDKSEPSG